MDERDYKEDMKINEDDLSSEWLEQPSIYIYYAETHAKALYMKEKISNYLDLVQAQLDSEIRRDWEKHFDKAPTETAIKNWILKQEKYKKALDKYQKASYKVNLMQSVKVALDHRKKALENLVTLFVSGFHSEPKIKRSVIKEAHLGLRKKKV